MPNTTPTPLGAVHRGVVRAAGIVLSADMVPMFRVRQRALASWSPDAAVFEVDGGFLVRFGQPRWLDCRRSPGLPVVEAGGLLLALPLSQAQVERLAAPRGALVRLRAGELRVDALRSERLDLSAWLDPGPLRSLAATGLGRPPEPPRATMLEAPPFDARQRFEGIPPAAPERAAMLRALDESGHQAGAARRGARWLAVRLAAAFQGALARWRGLSGPSAGSGAAGRGAGAQPPEPRPLPAPLRWLVGKLMVLSQLGHRHTRYLARLMDMFERGDVDAALRHAIPIGGPAAERLLSLLRTPAPREALTLRPEARPSSGVIGLGDDLLAELERLYRAAFRRLEAQGRVDEAAFILAELLHANEEAVSFLERHGRLRLAAEMAEARALSPALVVRQWFLAGERARAVEIARRRGGFGGAVARLERSRRHDEAAALRLLWADALASQGDLSRAVAVIWQVPRARPLAMGWIERGIEQGGSVGAALLVKKVLVDPGAFKAVRQRAVAILEDDGADGLATRVALAEALAGAKTTRETATLARAAVRALVRDAALFELPPKAERLNRLVALAGDGALRADLPPPRGPGRGDLRADGQPMQVTIEAGDAGTVPILDAAYLENGRALVALGESGVSFRSREGREIALFDVPAHRLVVSDAGDKAIAVARRGAVCRLARLDLVRRTARDWCDAPIDAFAPDFDGARWFVATSDLHAIDVDGPRFDGPWAVSNLVPQNAGSVRIARSKASCAVFVPGDPPQVWSYELPSLTLRARSDVPPFGPDDGPVEHRELSPAGWVIEHALGPALATDEAASPRLRWCRANGRWSHTATGAPDELPGRLAATKELVAAVLHGADGCRVALVDLERGCLRATISLGQSREVALRFGAGTLTAADDRGRLIVLDLVRGWLLRDLRL